MNNDITSIGLPPIIAPLAGSTQNFPSIISVEDQKVFQELEQGNALLFAVTGSEGRSRFLLNTENTIVGRSPEFGIILDDVTVSRKHAEFINKGDKYFVKDCGSLNGTYVNRDQVIMKEIQNGDEIQIGKFRLIFYAK